jgi:signal peptidase I
MNTRAILRWGVRLCTLLGIAGSLAIVGANQFSSANDHRHFKIDGGSMKPTLDVGEVITVRTTEYPQVGDVITFLRGGTTTTHRVMSSWKSTTPSGDIHTLYATRGDANTHDDPWVVIDDQVIGTVLPTPFYTLIAVELAEHPAVLAVLFLPLLLSLFITELNTVWKLVKGTDDEECPERESNPQDVAIRGV